MMHGPPPAAAAAAVPTYALYGEAGEDPALEVGHCESITERSVRHDWRIGPHRHEALLQFLYLRGGGGTAEVDGRAVALGPGSLLVLPPLSVHGFTFTPDVDGWVVTLPESHLDGVAGTLAMAVAAPRHVALASGSEAAVELDRLFERIAAELNADAAGRVAALRALLSLTLVWIARAAGAADGTDIPGRRLSHVQRFRAMIEDSFRAPRPIGDYAAALGITATQLNRLCRASFGRSALAMLHDRALLEAKRSLIYTNATVNEIAYALGFADPAYFSRFFAQRVGAAPTAFRRTAQARLSAGARSRAGSDQAGRATGGT